MSDNSDDFTKPHNITIPQGNPDDDQENVNEEVKEEDEQNYEEGEASGTATDPDKDDNVLDTAHKTGIYEDATEKNPVPLDIAGEIEKDEKGQAKIPPEKLPGDEDTNI